jgi:beta-1,4-N-acetylglucosaminyltransferase
MKKIIFVTVGTGKFDDLIKEVDSIAPHLNEKIIMQIGNGEYLPKNCNYFRFSKSLEQWYKKSWLVIAHGGAGTTFELLKKQMKLISVANIDRTDTHQEDILRALSEKKNLFWCKNIKEIRKNIISAKKFVFKQYRPPRCTIDEKINAFIIRTSTK